MYSPVTGSKSPVVDSFDIPATIAGYKKDFGIDVSKYFKDMKELVLYECPDTKLRFFYPAALAGDGPFYTSLEDVDIYYQDWKWEYDEAFKIINQGASVLDIGCGRGAFLDKMKKEKQCDVFGLEFNPSAFQTLQQKGIPASMQSIQDYSKTNREKYDVVTFFQVLEHISDVKSFMESSIACLKKGGLLIVGVPNNDPYLFGNNKYEWLNLPPHHMGWWNKESLTNLATVFNLQVQTIKPSPFRDYNSYLRSVRRNAEVMHPSWLWWVDMVRPIRKQWIQLFKNSVPGFFILAVYIKK